MLAIKTKSPVRVRFVTSILDEVGFKIERCLDQEEYDHYLGTWGRTYIGTYDGVYYDRPGEEAVIYLLTHTIRVWTVREGCTAGDRTHRRRMIHRRRLVKFHEIAHALQDEKGYPTMHDEYFGADGLCGGFDWSAHKEATADRYARMRFYHEYGINPDAPHWGKEDGDRTPPLDPRDDPDEDEDPTVA